MLVEENTDDEQRETSAHHNLDEGILPCPVLYWYKSASYDLL
jgi:hypothetical protein